MGASLSGLLALMFALVQRSQELSKLKYQLGLDLPGALAGQTIEVGNFLKCFGFLGKQAVLKDPDFLLIELFLEFRELLTQKAQHLVAGKRFVGALAVGNQQIAVEADEPLSESMGVSIDISAPRPERRCSISITSFSRTLSFSARSLGPASRPWASSRSFSRMRW